MPFTDTHSRRLTAGVCLIAGPGLTVAGWAMIPSVDSDGAAWAREVAADPSRTATALFLVIVGAALSVLAYLALVHLLRERQPLIGDLGGALTIIGLVPITAVLGVALAEVEMVRELGSSAETAALIEAIDGSTAVSLLFIAPVFTALGLVVLAVGLARARTAPIPAAMLLGAGAVVESAGFAMSSVPFVVIGFAGMFLGLAIIGLELLFETDPEWDHAPQYDGFRRLPLTAST